MDAGQLMSSYRGTMHAFRSPKRLLSHVPAICIRVCDSLLLVSGYKLGDPERLHCLPYAHDDGRWWHESAH